MLRPLRTFLEPLQDTISIRDYLQEQQTGTDGPADGHYASCRRGGHLEDLTSETIAAIVEHASDSASEASGITMIYWHGPWCSISQDNAFGFRRTRYEYWIHSYWQAARERAKALAWVQKFFAAMVPFSTGAIYVNDLENEGEARPG
ncbi:MAG TPA: hypothetical protein VMF50_05820 [Candidatus Binataceae bacterium]|nr:hypothetical protein [Candidatus Binataceae bacterium]